MADILTVTDTVDREFVDEHQEILLKLEGLAESKRHWEARQADAAARIATIDVSLATIGTRIRRGLVRYKPALDGSLPATLVDSNLDRDTPDEITIRWNAAAQAHRTT